MAVLNLIPKPLNAKWDLRQHRVQLCHVTQREVEAGGGCHWLSHTECQSQLWDRTQVCHPSQGGAFVWQCSCAQRGERSPVRGNGISTLKRCRAHKSQARPSLFPLLNPRGLPVRGGSGQHLRFAALRASVSLDVFPAFQWGLLGGPPILEKMKEACGGFGWGRREIWQEDEEACSLLFCPEACPGVLSASPQLPPPLSPHRRGLEEGRAQAPQPSLTASPSCSETEQAFNMGWGEGPRGPSLPTKGSISVRTGFPLAP